MPPRGMAEIDIRGDVKIHLSLPLLAASGRHDGAAFLQPFHIIMLALIRADDYFYIHKPLMP